MTRGATAADLRRQARRVLDLCRARGLRVATAESCTGGLVAGALTEIAGSSDVVDRGFVTYSNEAKQAMLGVPAATLKRHGAVSRETAAAMVKGALKNSLADIAVSITGIAGPGGGTKQKPVGLVYFAAARRGGKRLAQRRLYGNIGRSRVRAVSVSQALTMLETLGEGSAVDRRAQAGRLLKPVRANSSAPDAFRRRYERSLVAEAWIRVPAARAPNRPAGRRHRLHSSFHRRCRTWFRKCFHTCRRRGFHRRRSIAGVPPVDDCRVLRVKEAKNCRRSCAAAAWPPEFCGRAIADVWAGSERWSWRGLARAVGRVAVIRSVPRVVDVCQSEAKNDSRSGGQ